MTRATASGCGPVYCGSRESQSGLRLSDLTRSVELPKATVYRILTTLEARGYLDRGEGGAYCVAKKLGDMQRDVPIVQILGRVAQRDGQPGDSGWGRGRGDRHGREPAGGAHVV
jgi:hypothetical protein